MTSQGFRNQQNPVETLTSRITSHQLRRSLKMPPSILVLGGEPGQVKRTERNLEKLAQPWTRNTHSFRQECHLTSGLQAIPGTAEAEDQHSGRWTFHGHLRQPRLGSKFSKAEQVQKLQSQVLTRSRTIYLELLHIEPQVRCVLLLQRPHVSVIKKESSQS